MLPELDGLFGGMRWLHSLAFSVALLAVVMVVSTGASRSASCSSGCRSARFLHLVFDGAWATTEVFWWPFSGASIGDEPLPSVQRGWWNVPLEAIGLADHRLGLAPAPVSPTRPRRRAVRPHRADSFDRRRL